MKVLITGGNGFIGSNLAQFLVAKGFEVGVINLKNNIVGTSNSANFNFKQYELDYADVKVKDILKNYDYVIHLAYSTVPENSTLNPQFDIDSNVIKSLHLLKYAKEACIRKIIFISSGGVIYGSWKGLPFVEEDQPFPFSSYGITKLMIEKYLQLYKQFYDLDYCVLRVSNVYGAQRNMSKNQGVIPIWINSIHRDLKIKILGDGSITRDYIYITDVCSAFYSAIINDLSGTFNVSSGKGYTLLEIRDLIQEELKQTFSSEFLTARNFDVNINVLSNEKFKNAANWLPKIDIKEGIQLTHENLIRLS